MMRPLIWAHERSCQGHALDLVQLCHRRTAEREAPARATIAVVDLKDPAVLAHDLPGGLYRSVLGLEGL
jgi:hypothetical protein